jgi:VanZ family protein
MRIPKPVNLLRLAQFAFWAALLFTFAEAVMPARKAILLFRWDKAEHFVAFYVLTILAASAFPRRSLLLIAAVLSAFGASIELVQALPFVNRDCSFWDWVADAIAIGAALAPMALVWWRTEFGRRTESNRPPR